ncbi:MAG: hypothetical protein IT363_15900 [Methanoregulaceae archaeon]|nr:hypothetical protein [Methanoregulaceae archaeon]
MKYVPLLMPAVASMLLLAGCSKSNDLSGQWRLTQGVSEMDLTFTGGQYSGTMVTIPGATVKGTYKIEGDVLIMEPPTISGPQGTVTPQGGTMRVKMVPQGPDKYELQAEGDKRFYLTRLSGS